mmetsp:Transcript_57488/g.67127  ORF Transcript_57488/g.67127 Transcript_57488/m.67127 type:complete len:200 (-) Transcript_57488:137-736(-)|eukprot:CAMPEP_0194370110 /NCGR_PEP_ID=MMETSP0174-20130528/18433_1 /TAXON_ID=216777 /ORGANISM="Proboscia alata, Strain PI-D3" /LENGTH=199 /DNA_ID=CAMNT_0039147405 /DNA_START=65 /DNA_END=664 /DNA_ORIENTATION=-
MATFLPPVSTQGKILSPPGVDDSDGDESSSAGGDAESLSSSSSSSTSSPIDVMEKAVGNNVAYDDGDNNDDSSSDSSNSETMSLKNVESSINQQQPHVDFEAMKLRCRYMVKDLQDLQREGRVLKKGNDIIMRELVECGVYEACAVEEQLEQNTQQRQPKKKVNAAASRSRVAVSDSSRPQKRRKIAKKGNSNTEKSEQ